MQPVVRAARRSALAAVGLSVLICSGCQAHIRPPARSTHTPRPTASSALHPTPQGSTPTAPVAVTRAWLIAAIEHVADGAPRFAVRDSTGSSMDTLKVVPYAGGYLGIYHCFRHRRFEVRVATSTDLRNWTFRSTLDAHASQPTLARTPLGGYLLAEEGDNGARSGPGRRFLRFRYYPSSAQLLRGRAQRTFDAPHTLAAPRRGAEGTPSVYDVALRPDIAHSRIEVGLHYSAHGVDHEARGSLVNFHTWTAHPDHAFDRALLTIGMRGKHGDRDAIATTAGEFIIVECQDGSDDIWRLAWYDPRRESARLLSPHTPGASRSFANPTLTYVHLPDGASGVVLTAFVPQTGAGRGESGELVYRRRLPASSPTGRTP